MDVRQSRLVRWLLRWVCERKGHNLISRHEEIYGRVFEIKECKRCRYTVVPNDFWGWLITGRMRELEPQLRAILTQENPLLAALKEREPLRKLDGGATIIEAIKGDEWHR